MNVVIRNAFDNWVLLVFDVCVLVSGFFQWLQVCVDIFRMLQTKPTVYDVCGAPSSRWLACERYGHSQLRHLSLWPQIRSVPQWTCIDSGVLQEFREEMGRISRTKVKD